MSEGSPKGPKIETFLDLPPALKFSNENDNFKRAIHQGHFLVGNSEGQNGNLEERLKFSSELGKAQGDIATRLAKHKLNAHHNNFDNYPTIGGAEMTVILSDNNSWILTAP